MGGRVLRGGLVGSEFLDGPFVFAPFKDIFEGTVLIFSGEMAWRCVIFLKWSGSQL